IHADQESAAIRQSPRQLAIAREDVAAASHVEPGASRHDQLGHDEFIDFVGSEVIEAQAHASRPAVQGGILIAVLATDECAQLLKRYIQWPGWHESETRWGSMVPRARRDRIWPPTPRPPGPRFWSVRTTRWRHGPMTSTGRPPVPPVSPPRTAAPP